jgi:hypothetical protein
MRVLHIVMEDWGWVVMVESRGLRLWIGCGHSGEADDGLNCFVDPNALPPWRWFRRTEMREVIAELEIALEEIISRSGKAQDMLWITDRVSDLLPLREEVARRAGGGVPLRPGCDPTTLPQRSDRSTNRCRSTC